MKISLFLLWILLFSNAVYALKLSATTSPRCYLISDERPDNTAFYFYKPNLQIIDDELILTANYAYATCQKINGVLKYAPSALPSTSDKLLIQQPKGTFDVSVSFIEMHPRGFSQFTRRWNLNEILTTQELESYRRGETLHKFFDIYYGRHLAGTDPNQITNYRRSSGKYILEFELTQASITIRNLSSGN